MTHIHTDTDTSASATKKKKKKEEEDDAKFPRIKSRIPKELNYDLEQMKKYDLDVNLTKMLMIGDLMCNEFDYYMKKEIFDLVSENCGLRRLNTETDDVDDEEVIRRDESHIITYKTGPIKQYIRCREKIESDYSHDYFPQSSRLIDVIRGSITFTSVKHFNKSLRFIIDYIDQRKQLIEDDHQQEEQQQQSCQYYAFLLSCLFLLLGIHSSQSLLLSCEYFEDSVSCLLSVSLCVYCCPTHVCLTVSVCMCVCYSVYIQFRLVSCRSRELRMDFWD